MAMTQYLVSQCESNVNVSSRTPEGLPGNCPLCGAKANIEFSDPAGDAPCPKCGYLLWASAQHIQSVARHFADALGTSTAAFNADTRFPDLGVDSLDAIEMIMELEEEFDIRIPEDVAMQIRTIADAVRYIQNYRRDGEG